MNFLWGRRISYCFDPPKDPSRDHSCRLSGSKSVGSDFRSRAFVLGVYSPRCTFEGDTDQVVRVHPRRPLSGIFGLQDPGPGDLTRCFSDDRAEVRVEVRARDGCCYDFGGLAGVSWVIRPSYGVMGRNDLRCVYLQRVPSRHVVLVAASCTVYHSRRSGDHQSCLYP